MEGQEEGETFYEENGSSTEEAAKDTSNITLPIGKKNVVQINFFKDRTSGMYKCQMCSYKSMHRSSIKSHYAVHSSLRPYACDQCSYEAKRLNDLRKHKLIKHGKKLISVRKKHNSAAAAGTNGVSSKSPKYAESDNNESHMEEQESEGGVSGNLLYQSLLGSGTNSNGPVFPQPEPANVASSPNTSSSPCHEQSISAGDLPEEIDKEGTVVVKPEPPDDYYTFQNKFPEQDDPIVIPAIPPIASEAALKSCSPSKSPSRGSPAAAFKSVAQSTSGKDAGESEATRLHAASPSVISLLLQRRNLTGSSLISSGSILANTAQSSSQPKALKPVQRSTPTLYTSAAATDSRFSAPQYNSHNSHNNSHNNPLNLSFNHNNSGHHQHGTGSGPTRSNSESSSASASAFPSSTVSGGRSRGVETARGWTCDHCNIMFFDSAIYFMHMGLHAPDAAWQCNLCGKQLYDVYSFTSHFLNGHVAT